MKKVLFTSLFIGFIFLSGFAQTQGSINNDIETYIVLTKEKKFTELMEYINPKLFEVMPKEMMVEVFESMMNDPEMNIEFGDFEVTNIYPTVEDGEDLYALVDYDMDMSITLIAPEDEAYDEEALATMKGLYEMMFGEGNVRVEGKNTFVISSSKTMIASKYPDAEHWYFVEQTTEMEGLLDSMVPKEVQEKLNKSKYTD